MIQIVNPKKRNEEKRLLDLPVDVLPAGLELSLMNLSLFDQLHNLTAVNEIKV